MNRTFIPIEYDCNDNCISCPVPIRRNMENPQFENIKKEIDKILQTSRHIEFNGGEPTLRKDLLKILKYAQKKNPDEIGLLTNSQFFFYEKYAWEIAKIKHLKIITTLYGPNEKIHDAITQTPNSFKHKIGGIKNLIKNNVCIELRILLHKMNYKHFDKIADFLIKNFTPNDFNRIVILNPKLTEQAEKNKKVVAEKLGIIAKFLEKPIKKLDKARYVVELYHFPHCVLSGTLWRYCKGVTADASEIALTKQCGSCFKKEKCSCIWKSYLKIFGPEEFKSIKRK